MKFLDFSERVRLSAVLTAIVALTAFDYFVNENDRWNVHCVVLSAVAFLSGGSLLLLWMRRSNKRLPNDDLLAEKSPGKLGVVRLKDYSD